jgi:sugar phosphate permease
VRPVQRQLDIALLVLCQSSQALIIGGVALFLPLIRGDMNLSFRQGGALDAVATFSYALMQIPVGVMADRFGPRRLFLIGLAAVNVLSLTFALLHSYPFLIANQAVAGFFRALVFAPGLLLMTRLFGPEQRATAFGLFVAGGFSSSILLNLLGPPLVGPLGWRALFACFALIGGLLAAICWRRSARWPVASQTNPMTLRQALALARSGSLWMLGAIQYVRLATAFGLAVWLPSYIVADRHRSLAVAGAVVAASAALTAPSNFLGGYLADRLRRPSVVVGGSLLVLAVTLPLVPRVHGFALVVCLLLVAAAFVQFYFGPLFAIGLETFGERSAGAVTGIGNFFANVGAVSAVYALGAIKDATGSFTTGFDLLAGICIGGCVLTAGFSRHTARQRAETAA